MHSTQKAEADAIVTVGLPDVRGRISILKHHMADVAYDTDVDASVIARGCPGMSGADLQNLVNQAAVKASRDGSTTVQLKHFEWAKGTSHCPCSCSAPRLLSGGYLWLRLLENGSVTGRGEGELILKTVF